MNYNPQPSPQQQPPQQPAAQYPYQQQQYAQHSSVVQPAPTFTPPRRKRRRWPIVLAILLLIFIVIGVVADRIAESFIEKQLVSAAESELSSADVSAEDVEVEIGGFGFLPQVLFGTISEVKLTSGEAAYDELRIQSAEMVFRDVEVPWGIVTGDVPSGVKTGEASIAAYTTLSDLEAFVRSELSGASDVTLSVRDSELHASISPQDTSETLQGVVNIDNETGRMTLQLDENSEYTSPYLRDVASQGIATPNLFAGFDLDSIAATDSNTVKLSASSSGGDLTL